VYELLKGTDNLEAAELIINMLSTRIKSYKFAEEDIKFYLG